MLFYCVPDGYVGFDAVDAMPRFYEQGGDFAVAALIATQYGLAGMAQAGIDADDQDAITAAELEGAEGTMAAQTIPPTTRT